MTSPMSRRRAAILASAALAAGGLAAALSSVPAAADCTFYAHANYGGRSLRLRTGEQIALSHTSRCDWCNDAFSSYRVGADDVAIVAVHYGRGGPSDMSRLRGTSPYIGDRLNDEISYIRCVSQAPRHYPEPACAAYMHSNQEGHAIAIRAGEEMPHLTGGRNDAYSSFVVQPGHQLVIYQHAYFTGDQRTFGPGRHDLVGDSFNDQTSSLRCERRR